MSNGSYTQKQIDTFKQIGAQGGTVSTTGLNHQDKAAIDAAVNQGRQGK